MDIYFDHLTTIYLNAIEQISYSNPHEKIVLPTAPFSLGFVEYPLILKRDFKVACKLDTLLKLRKYNNFILCLCVCVQFEKL